MQEQEVIIHQQQAEFVNQKPVPKAQEIEFLEKYEIKNWEFSPRIYKILAASAVFNILALLVFAQTNILQARACDSPWVNRVCQVLDTVYVGSTILNTDSGFVDKPYEKSELEDAEIVWINQTGTEPLNYPGGYFALANPESQFTAMQDPTLMNPDLQGFQNFPPPSTNFPTQPPMPITPPASMNLPPQKLPPAAKNQVNIPDNIIGENPIGNNTRKGNRNAKPENQKPIGNLTAENKQEDPTKEQTVEKTDPVTDIELNRRPLDELGEYVNGLLNEKKVDLQTPFIVQAKGKLNKEGKFDKNSYKIIQASSSDEDMLAVVQRSIAAINDSGYLQYLKQLSGKDLSLLLKQDDTNITAEVESEVESETRAKSLKSTLDLAIYLVRSRKENEEKKTENDLDDLELLKGATVEINGKKIIIKFNVKKEIAQPMIQRKLLAPKEDKAKSNSTAQTSNASEKTGK
jgi:hypothetical protein